MQFQYASPPTVNETIAFLHQNEGEAKIIAGGTDLYIKLNNRVFKTKYVVDLEGIPGLNLIKHDPQNGLTLGALATIRSLEKSTELQHYFPIISAAAGNLGSVAIRNVATVGGNLCNALPSAETAPALIGLAARLKIAGPDGDRIVALEDFFTGSCQTVLKNDEILIEIQVPEPAARTRGVYFKFSPRGTIDPAIAGLAAVITFEEDNLTCKEARIVLGAVAPTPLRAKEAEDVLKGEKITEELVRRCSDLAARDARPRTSPEFKKEIVKVLVKRALNAIKSRDP
jgi:CO/xanthine dehydrogenase FAD-binding subunit